METEVIRVLEQVEKTMRRHGDQSKKVALLLSG